MGFKMQKPKDLPGSAVPAVMTGLFISFGGVLFGYDTGTIGGILAMPYWQKTFSTGYINPESHHLDITSTQKSTIVSLLSAGTFFGSLLSAPVADHVGRRWAMILNTAVFCLGVIFQTAATEIPLFVVGRFLAGLGVGLLSATIPLYQSETAPKWIRGTVVGCYQWAITIGLLLAAVVLNATKTRNDTGCYRIPIAVQFAFAIILWIGMIFLPETPRYLIKVGKKEAAVASLSKLRRLPVDHPAITEELAEIEASYQHELDVGSASYLACFRPPILKRQLTGMALQALQQLTGVNFIFYYGTSYFTQSGIENAFVITMITSVVNVLSTIPGLYLVEVWGRRPLLMFGAVGMSVCQLIVASVGTALPHSEAASKCLIAFVCVYIFFFASTWGPCAWVVTGEIFPLKARAKGLSMTTASNWLLNFAIAYATPYMVDPGAGNANLGSKVFFVWGGFCVICCAFVHFCIFETKGLSLEQVDELFEKVPHAWMSKNFVPTIWYHSSSGGDKSAAGAWEATLGPSKVDTVERKVSASVHVESS